MLRVASDGLVAPPGLLDRPSDLSQLSVNAVAGSRPCPFQARSTNGGAPEAAGLFDKSVGARFRLTEAGFARTMEASETTSPGRPGHDRGVGFEISRQQTL